MRSSGAEASSTKPVVPLKTAPAPPPINEPATRNSARLGADMRTEVTSSAKPTSIEIEPSTSTRDGGIRFVASCAATPDENTTNRVAPDRACEGWSNVVARNSPESPANRPLAANAASVASAAGIRSPTEREGPAGMLFAGAVAAEAPVSGAPSSQTSPINPSAMNTR